MIFDIPLVGIVNYARTMHSEKEVDIVMLPLMMSQLSTELIRVRLFFDNLGSCSSLRNRKVWMVINLSVCKVVKDFKKIIKARFFRNQSVKLSLYVDDFVLPSDEVIQIIRDNDIVR